MHQLTCQFIDSLLLFLPFIIQRCFTEFLQITFHFFIFQEKTSRRHFP